MKLHILDKYIYMFIAGILVAGYSYYKYIQYDRASLRDKLADAETNKVVIMENSKTEISNKENIIKFEQVETELNKEFDGNDTFLSPIFDNFLGVTNE